ncbi:hypothetical protein QQP08_017414 [Theobroma cacao]|nr:hypothetical protein QQP08_017414 [Theobroma cacao]
MPMHSAKESRNRLGRLFQHKVFRNEEEAAIIQQQGNVELPIAQKAMKAQNEILLIRGDLPSFHGGSEIVHPTEATAFAATQEPRPLRQSPPPSFTFPLDVTGQ